MMMNEKRKAAIVDRCLVQVQDGKLTLEECLRRYPQLSGELTSAFHLLNAFRTVDENNLLQQELRETKVRLLNQLPDRPSVVTNSRPNRYTWQTDKRRFAMTWVIIITTLLTMVTGTGVVYASGEALPGDALYPVKTLTENVQLALASEEGDAQLTLHLIQTRMEEMQELMVQGREDDLDEAASGYEKQTKAMTQLLAAVQAQDPDEAIRLRTELEQQLQDQARQMQSLLEDEETTNGDQTRTQLQEMLQTNTQTRLRINQTVEDVPDEEVPDEGGDLPEGEDLTAETVDDTAETTGNGAQVRSSEFINASGDGQNATFTFQVANAEQLGVYAEIGGARYACSADGDMVTCNIPNAAEKGTLNLFCLTDNSFLYSYDYDYDWLGTKEAGSGGENGQAQQGGSTTTTGGSEGGQGGSGKGGK
jgi:uncharacterized membrane protein YgcG